MARNTKKAPAGADLQIGDKTQLQVELEEKGLAVEMTPKPRLDPKQQNALDLVDYAIQTGAELLAQISSLLNEARAINESGYEIEQKRAARRQVSEDLQMVLETARNFGVSGEIYKSISPVAEDAKRHIYSHRASATVAQARKVWKQFEDLATASIREEITRLDDEIGDYEALRRANEDAWAVYNEEKYGGKPVEQSKPERKPQPQRAKKDAAPVVAKTDEQPTVADKNKKRDRKLNPNNPKAPKA